MRNFKLFSSFSFTEMNILKKIFKKVIVIVGLIILVKIERMSPYQKLRVIKQFPIVLHVTILLGSLAQG